MPKIRKILIQNFRSIRRVEIDATDLTVLVGDNDCGKSNILRALNLFFNGQTNPGQNLNFADDFNRYARRAKRAREILVELTLELPASYRKTNGDFIQWRKLWRDDGIINPRDYKGLRKTKTSRNRDKIDEIAIPQKSNVHALLSRIEFEFVPAIRTPDFFRQLRGRIYGVIAQVAEGGFRETSSDFEAAIAVNVKSLIEDVATQLSDVTQLRLPNDLSAIFERLDFLSGDASISLDSRGDGIKGRYIPLILKFMAEKKQSLLVRGGQPHTFIWAYEEPENNLEFRRAQELAESFIDLAKRELTQVLVTTHSPLFFNMRTDNPALCAARYVHRQSDEEGTVVDTSIEGADILDEKMGVMMIIAPHIKKAQDEIATLRASRNEVFNIIRSQQLPALFVEGITDYVVFGKLIETYFEDQRGRFCLQTPPTMGAGAAYVADRLVAWGLIQRSLPTGERKRAFGVLDYDKAGEEACGRIDAANLDAKLVKRRRLSRPTHLHEAATLGIVPAIRLEEHYPIDWWAKALTNGWLVKRDRKTAISDSLSSRILNGDSSWDDILNSRSWSAIADHTVSSEHKHTWAKWVSKQPRSELDKLDSLKSILAEAIDYLSPGDQ